MIIAAAMFAVFLVTALVNGWGELQTRYAGKEIRFLLLVPIYLMVRRYPDAGLWLLRGGVVAGFVFLGHAFYDVYVVGMYRAQGVYSPNFLGPLAALFAVSTFVLWRIDGSRRWWRTVILLSAFAGLLAVAYSASRGAFVGLIGMLLVWAGLTYPRRYLAFILVGIVCLALLGYFGSERVRWGVDSAVSELESVAARSSAAPQTNAKLGSVAARLEMWRASWMVFLEHPILGVGRGNYVEAAAEHVAEGDVHKEVMEHSHPHNAYLEVLVSKGIVGLAVFLALLFYPLVLFVRTRRRAPETATLGCVFIAGFALFSFTDASTYIKGNFIAVFVVYLAVLFSWHVRMLQRGEH